MQNISTFLLYLLLAYILLFLLFQLCANYAMYHPPRPATYQDNQHIIKIDKKNNQQLSAIYLKAPNSTITFLFSHGNAGDLGSFSEIIELFYQHGYSILAYDYSGYGTSTGYPSEKNSYDDILHAYQYLTNTLKIDPQNIIIYGQSIGAGPSIELASHYPAKALILEGAFVSAFQVMTRIPLFAFDKYQNLKKISKIKIPIFIIQGTHDTVIQPWHGKKLFATIEGKKKAYWVSGADHNDLFYTAGQQYWEELADFIREIKK